MSEQSRWTGNITLDQQTKLEHILQNLADAFNQSPFFVHNRLNMRVVNQQLQGYFEMQPHLIGNVFYQILHGGIIASILDSIGGVVAMSELYRRAIQQPEKFNLETTSQQVARLATLDMRVDYIAPGRGAWFVASAELVRLGNKSALLRMNLHNDQNLLIATAMASFSF